MTLRDWSGLAVLALLFLAWHVPLVYRTEAGLDEDWYGVPGITILQRGLPQIPYIPSREPSSACFKADVILDALPPLTFYLQALVHLVLGPGIGAARMTSVLAALAACVLVYDLARLWFGQGRFAFVAAAAYLLARAVYFPATTARPDMVAVACALLAIDAAVRHRRRPWRFLVIVAGVAAGLSLLAHPFGVVPTSQVGLALLSGPGSGRQRLGNALLCTSIAMIVFALWLPLILLHPDIFRIQFGSNVLGRAGPGLGASALAPWSVLAYHLRQIANHLQPIQAILYGVALVGGTAVGWRTAGTRDFVYHLWASWLLLSFFEGKHPTLGYYAYPTATTSIALAVLASRAAAGLPRVFGPAPVCWLLLAAFLPGAGVRTALAHLRHWNDPAYDAHALARALLRDTPPEAVTAVDGAYVLDFYLAGRPVLEATIHRLSYDFRSQSFEYVVFARDGLRRFRPLMNDLVLIRSYGDRSDVFAPYAELYRRVAGGTIQARRPSPNPPT
jgi:hypothetical protein